MFLSSISGMFSAIFATFNVIILISTSVESIPFQGYCYVPTTYVQDPIDTDRISGSWYEVVRSPVYHGEPTYRCNYINRVPSSYYGFYTLISGLRNFNGFQQYSQVSPVNLLGYSGTMTVYDINEDGSITNGHQDWFLYLDYDKYLVIYSCRDNTYTPYYPGMSYGYLSIQSRSPTICDEDYEMITNVLANSGVWNYLSNAIVDVDQTNCPKQSLEDELALLDGIYVDTSILGGK